MADWLRDEAVPAVSRHGSILIGILISFAILRYSNTGINPFNANSSAIPVILIAAILVHVISAILMNMKYFNDNDDLLMIRLCVCLAAGVLASELLLFISVIQIWMFAVVNVSLAILIAPVLLRKCFPQSAAATVDADEQPPDVGMTTVPDV